MELQNSELLFRLPVKDPKAIAESEFVVAAARPTSEDGDHLLRRHNREEQNVTEQKSNLSGSVAEDDEEEEEEERDDDRLHHQNNEERDAAEENSILSEEGKEDEERACEIDTEVSCSSSPSLGDFKATGGDDDDGFKTPTSLEHKIPVILQCPPPPKKSRTILLSRIPKCSIVAEESFTIWCPMISIH